MSHVEYYDGLAEIALGWLGWSEEQALRADVNAILIGYAGKLDLFETIGYLKPAEEAEAPKNQAPLPEMNPRLFQALFAKQ